MKYLRIKRSGMTAFKEGTYVLVVKLMFYNKRAYLIAVKLAFIAREHIL